MRGMGCISTGAVIAATMLPVPGSADVTTPERISAFVDVMAQNNCRMTNHRADVLFPQTGFDDKTETKVITEQLLADGRARILESQLVVFGGKCGAIPKHSGRERFFAAVADNGCAVKTAHAETVLSRVGVELQEVRLLMDRMLTEGQVTLSSDESTVTLEAGVCSNHKGLLHKIAALDPVFAAPATRSTDEARRDFLTYMASVDCTLTRAEARRELPRAGFEAKEVRPIIKALIDAGEAEMAVEDDRLTINPEVCQ